MEKFLLLRIRFKRKGVVDVSWYIKRLTKHLEAALSANEEKQKKRNDDEVLSFVILGLERLFEIRHTLPHLSLAQEKEIAILYCQFQRLFLEVFKRKYLKVADEHSLYSDIEYHQESMAQYFGDSITEVKNTLIAVNKKIRDQKEIDEEEIKKLPECAKWRVREFLGLKEEKRNELKVRRKVMTVLYQYISTLGSWLEAGMKYI